MKHDHNIFADILETCYADIFVSVKKKSFSQLRGFKMRDLSQNACFWFGLFDSAHCQFIQ